MILRKTDLKSFYISFKKNEIKKTCICYKQQCFSMQHVYQLYKRWPFVIDVLYYEFTHTRCMGARVAKWVM